MIENFRILFYTLLGALSTLILPSIIENYRGSNIYGEISSVSFSIGSRGDDVFDAIYNLIERDARFKGNINIFSGTVNVARFDVINDTAKREEQIEFVVPLNSIVFRHNNLRSDSIIRMPSRGINFEQVVGDRVRITSIDPKSLTPFTIITFGYDHEGPVKNLISSGKSASIVYKNIQEDYFGIKTIVNNNEFMMIATMASFLVLAVFVPFIFYSEYLRRYNYDLYYRRFGKSQLLEAERLVTYNRDQKMREKLKSEEQESQGK